MASAGLVGMGAVAWALAVGAAAPEAWRGPWLYAPAFLLAGIAHAGVRLGRKTWLVDAAPDEHRPTYVATANTVIGGVTVVGGGLGAAARLTATGGRRVTAGVDGAEILVWEMHAGMTMLDVRGH
jgi:MFS family permease